LDNKLHTESDKPSSWFETFFKTSFLLRFFSPVGASYPEMPVLPFSDAPFAIDPLASSNDGCLVEPLSAIEDTKALTFEESVGTSAIVNLDGLTPTTASALSRFERIVNSAGGTLALTSAFRPSGYQEHLQEVWDKWMGELRHNSDDECQSLKADVRDEFERHQLLESQRPATFSDHTLGIGIDAAVILPKRRRRSGIDRLARKAGFLRPDARRDPVHFRLIGGRV
jgi:hypothetical protein